MNLAPSGWRGPEGAPGFRFVDFAARRRPGFRNCLIPLGRVPAFVNRYGAFGCYATFFLFDEDLLRHAREHRRGGRPSVAGYEGPVAAAVWALDVDAADLDQAVGAAREIDDHLQRVWDIPEAALRVYFSGKKGFHITVDARAFGPPPPSASLPGAFHRLTFSLARELGLPAPGPLDLSLGDRLRLLRLPNTRHEGSGLYKVPISLRELRGLEAAKLRELARRPRPLRAVEPAGLISARPVPVSAKARLRFEEAASAAAPARPAFLPELPGAAALDCPARRHLLASPAPGGQRNNTAIRLASWLREGGMGEEEVAAEIGRWNRRSPEPLARGELTHVVRSAFAPARPYHYGCRDPLIAPHCPWESARPSACPYHRPRTAGEEAP